MPVPGCRECRKSVKIHLQWISTTADSAGPETVRAFWHLHRHDRAEEAGDESTENNRHGREDNRGVPGRSPGEWLGDAP